MRSITYKFTSVLLCFTLSLWLLLGSLALPRRAHAVLPVLGGAALAAGVSDVAYIGAFAALLAACGFSLASAVGADSNAPVASWSDEQLERAADKLQSWIDHAAEVSSRVELQQMLNDMPEPPEEPPDDDPDDDPPEVEGEKVQPKKSDASNPMDYMLALMAVNGGIGLASGFGGAISSLVNWANTSENDGGGGFKSADEVVYPPVSSGSYTFQVSPYLGPQYIGSSYNQTIYDNMLCSTGPQEPISSVLTSTTSTYCIADYGCGWVGCDDISVVTFNPENGTFETPRGVAYRFPARYAASESQLPDSANTYINTGGSNIRVLSIPYVTTLNWGGHSIDYSLGYISPALAKKVDSSYAPLTVGGLLYQIAGQNAQMQEAMQQMQGDTSAAVATLQQMYANDLSQSQAGTPQYVTIQAPYYVESGKTDPQTGQYTAHIVANDYNHGTISQYDDAVATNTSSPQPGNTGYNPTDYKGNSSSDVPPWQPLLDIHLDRVWPFSLIGDALGTFNGVYSLDGGEAWDWHIVVPLSSWNIALGGSHVFDDYDIDLSMWRDLFAYLAPWFLLYVFLALLAMARRLWLRWNDSGGDD